MQKSFLISILFLVHSVSAQSPIDQAIGYYNEAKEAYTKRDLRRYLAYMKLADSLLSYSRSIKYNLAVAHAVNHQTEESFKAIDELIWIDSSIPFNEDSAFWTIKSDKAYDQYLKKAKKQGEQITTSEVAFELDEVDLHPESVAFDQRTGLFYVSSLRKRKVVIFDPAKGTTYDWITSEEIRDLYGVMGIKLSLDRKHLWLCSAPIPEMEGYREDGLYTPTIFKFNLEDKTDFDRFALPVDAIPGDLVISSKSEVYISDSAVPRIFIIKKKRAQLFYDGQGKLINLQGITLNEETLFIADYLLGIYRMDLSDKNPTRVEISSPYNLAGVDGLYYYQNSLITIQNGVYPFRVGRYYLDEASNILNFEYFDKAGLFLDEPTLGVISDEYLYYVANSPWAYYEEGELQTERIKKPQIRKLNLSFE